MVRYYYQDTEFAFKPKLITKQWLKTVAGSEMKKLGDISIIFCSDNYILDTNIKYLQHDYFTDIITFDYCEGSTISGELIICPSVVNSNSKDFNTTFENELHRVIIHGVLHLLGYKDSTTEEQSEMRSQENKALLLFDQQMK